MGRDRSADSNAGPRGADAVMTERDDAPARRDADGARSGSQLVDARIGALDDWRGAMLADLRGLIRAADPAVVETVKWRKPSNAMLGVPVWEHAGILCTGETYRDYVKLTFARGAALSDPSGLFNASLTGGTRRAINIREGQQVDAAAFVALIRAAVAANLAQQGSGRTARAIR